MAIADPTAIVPDAELAPSGAPWIRLAGPGRTVDDVAPLNIRRLVWQLVGGTLAVLLLVTLASTVAASQLAEREAVNEAARAADVLAEAVVQPALTDAVAAGDPRALAAFDELVRTRILSTEIIRVKLWTAHGRVVYADEPQLIGKVFPLDEGQLAAMRNPVVKAEVSDLERSENTFERSSEKLVEVYRPVWTSTGSQFLFEVYTSYEPVRERAAQLWRGLTAMVSSSLLVLVLLTAPILWRVLRRLRQAQEHREALLIRAADATTEERHRIAASLHDGPVQDLIGTSLAVSGAAARVDAAGLAGPAGDLRTAASTVRASVGALRSLLVDIYPPNLETAGLVAALDDLVSQAASRGLDVRLEATEEAVATLTADQRRLVYRVTQECLRNAVRHAPKATVLVRLAGGESPVLDVVDDGPGFDASAVAAAAQGQHFGIRVLADVVSAAGGRLELATAPGRGTHWRLNVEEG